MSKSLAPIPATLALSALLLTPAYAETAAPATAPAPAAAPEAVDTNSEAYKKAYEKAYADAKARQAAEAKGETVAPETAEKDGKIADAIVTAPKVADAPSYLGESMSFKRPTPLLETPQQVIVVTQQQLRNRNATSLREAIQASPGITSNVGENGFATGDNFNIRGFSARSDIFIDGIRDTSNYARDMFATEQVEISRGANAMYQGRGSTGGSIGLATKTAHQGSAADIALTASTAESVRAVVDANYDISANTDSKLLKDAGAAFRVSVLGQDGGSARSVDIKDKRFGVLPSLTVGLGKQTQLSISHQYYDQQSGGDFGIPLQNSGNGIAGSPVNYSNWYGINGLSRDNVTSNLTTMTATTELDTGHRLRNTTRYNTNQRDTISVKPQNADWTTGVVTPAVSGRYTDDSMITNQTDYLGQFKTGEIGHTLNVGLELQQEKITNRNRSFGTAPAMNVWDPNHNVPHNITPTFTGAQTKGTANTFAAYVNETLHATEWLDVVGGLRVERFEFTNKAYGATTAPGTATTTTTLKSNDTMISWRGGLVFKPTDTWSLYGTVANTFQPSAQDLSVAANNTDTKPEETYLYEIGTKWEPIKGKLMLGLAYFYTDRSNIRQTDLVTNTQVLTGSAYSQGVELTASGNITQRWNVSAGVAYLNTDVTKNPSNTAIEGKSLTNTPDWSASVFTSYDIGMGWTIGGGARYVGDRWVNQDNTVKMDDYIVFDGMIRKQLTDYASIQINVDNIFEEEYIENTRNSQSQWGMPGAGRVISVTARLTF